MIQQIGNGFAQPGISWAPSYAPPTALSSIAATLSSPVHCVPDGSAAVLPVIAPALARAHRSDKRCPTTPGSVGTLAESSPPLRLFAGDRERDSSLQGL